MIKNTLFRFTSMRAPEHLDKKQVDLRFVQHPGIVKDSPGIFLSAIGSIPDKERKRVLNNTAASFSTTAWQSREEIREEIGHDFYDFAIWLSSNRTTFTVDDLNEFHPDSLSITDTCRLKLWDNLFYQIVTFTSGYVREAIISVLIADFFLNTKTESDSLENLLKIAQARVIIPKEHFGVIKIPSTETALQKKLDDLEISTRHLDLHAKRAIAASRITELEKVAKELKAAKTDYNKRNSFAFRSAQREHADHVKDIYKSASPEIQTYTDKETGLTKKVKSYPDITLPEFSFHPLHQLDDAELKKKLSVDTFDFIVRLKENANVYTFDEALEVIEADIQLHTETVFTHSNLRQAMTLSQQLTGTDGSDSGDGSGIWVGGSNSSGGSGSGNGNSSGSGSTSYTGGTTQNNPVFNINSIGITSGGKSSLLMVIDNMPTGIDIISASYVATTNSGEIFIGENDFIDTWIGGILHVTIFNTIKIDTNLPQYITLSGTFQLSNGDKVTFEGKCNITYDWIPNGGGGSTGRMYKGNGTFTYVPIELTDEEGDDMPVNGSVIDYKPSGFGVKRLGIADYRKVEQEVCCYVPGEVSNIENVMAREYKEKSTRRLRRSEDTLTTSKEQEKEKLTDTTTTDRFEMNREISNLLAEDTSIGLNASASYSPTPKSQLNIGADFAHNTTKEHSDNQAVTQAKEITERALERVVEKVKEERIIKIIEEYEETNKHGYDNREGNQHISGVYRWVDKIYNNKVVNYGKRLMYEFMIPEPAAFHDFAIDIKAEELPVKPIDPRVGDGLVRIATHKDVTPGNYHYWAAVYNAEVKALPESQISVGKSFAMENVEGPDESYSKNDSIEIPEGYIATSGSAMYAGHDDNDPYDNHVITVMFGNGSGVKIGSFNNVEYTPYYDIGNYKKEVPVSFQYYNYHTGIVNVNVLARLSSDVVEQWKLDTFNSIISAYEDRKAEYDARVAEIKGAVAQKAATNPLFYRQIENISLKKNCIAYLADHSNMGLDMLTSRGLMGVNAVYKEERLEKYASFVKFFEQAFEWDLMSYNFYPFYWAKQNKWKELYNIENDDPLFRSFLQSGMARVILTVRPGFEEVVNWYMGTGQIWNGGQVPTLDDPLFISIVEELKQPEGRVEETWESRVPTSLTVLQSGTVGLDEEGLPCNPECDEYKVFDKKGNVIKTLDNPIKSKKFEIGKAYDTNGEEIPPTTATEE